MQGSVASKLHNFLRSSLLFLFAVAAAHAQPALALAHPEGGFVQVNGAKLWYETEGTGEPLILIAGGPGFSHNYFHPYFASLAKSHRVIYFDSFGRGNSARASVRSEYTFDRDVLDLEALRKALALGKINVLGRSYGGLVAQAYALRYPNSVRRLILVDTLYSGEMWQANNNNSNESIRNQFPEVWEKIEQVRAQGHNTCSKEYQDVSGVPLSLMYFYNGQRAAEVERAGGPPNLDVYCAIAGEDADFLIGGDMGKLDFRPQLGTLSVPILVLADRYDRVSIPRWVAQFTRYAPQAKMVWFEQSGHFPFVEETEATMRAIDDFLK